MPVSSGARRAWLIARIVISLGLVAVLAGSVEWPRVLAAARDVSLPWLLISTFYIPASIALVAVRYRVLILRMVSLREMLRLVVLQGAVSTFVANAAGSLGLVAVLVKVYKVPMELSIRAMILARLGDILCALPLTALLAAITWRSLGPVQLPILIAMSAAAAVILLACALAAFNRRKPVPASIGSADNLPEEPSLRDKLRGVLARIARLESSYLGSILPGTFVYSLLLQALTATAMYLNAIAFGLPISFLEAATVGVIASLLASMPITIFGGLGVYEASTVGLLALFGVPIEAGASMILVVRAIFFGTMALAFMAIRQPAH